MKEKLKLIGIIAIIAVIGLAMAACGDEEPCDHQWGEWDITDDISFRECTICKEKESCFCDHLSDWIPSGSTASRNCTICERKVDDLDKSHFYGIWKHSTGAPNNNIHTIEINPNDFHLTSTAGTEHFYRYTGANLTWTQAASTIAADTKDTATKEAINSDLFPVGFALTGGATTAGGDFWGANTGPAWVYMKTSGDAIVVRLTHDLVTRIFTLTRE